MANLLVCKCGWTGTIYEQDALGTECGCCPDCGNEDLKFADDDNPAKPGKGK